MQKRNRLRTQWQRTRDITLLPLINSLKEQIRVYSAIKEQLSKTWQKTLQGLNTDNTNINPNISPLTIEGKIATANLGKIKHVSG
jgi:hypothetical protein